MSKLLSLFRWKGLLVFFALVVALFFSAPSVIKMTLENILESSFDARSTIERVDIDYAESRLQVQGVKVADKDEPMTNLFEWGNAAIDLNFYGALTGHFIVDEMSVSGLTFSTQRKNSGALPQAIPKDSQALEGKSQAEESDLDAEFADLSKALPSAEVLLAREPLQTIKLGEDLNVYTKQQELRWKEIESNLPERLAIKNYQQAIKNLQQRKIKNLSDFKAAKKELKSIKSNLKKDKKTLKEAKQFISTVAAESEDKIRQLKQAPKADFKLLKSKYKLSKSGALNVTGLLLGDQVQQITSKGLSVYQRIKPLLTSEDENTEEVTPRLSGHFVHYGMKKPSVWIKHMAIDGYYLENKFEATLSDLSHQPELIVQPAKLHLSSLNSASPQQQLTINGLVDYRDAEKHFEQLSLNLQNFPMQNWVIVDDEKMHIEMSQSELTVTAQVKRVSGLSSGDGKAVFNKVTFNNSATHSFGREVVSAISSVQRFNVSASFHRSIGQLKLRSDLDDQISAAISSRLKVKQKQLEKKLKEGINNHLKEALNNPQLASLLNSDAEIDAQLNAVEGLLKQELDSFSDSEKSKQKKKLKNKLKSLF
ncbi:MAG: TIGR03545 family protein [Sinobacterium sp.]|nr:TIGR03545 family protein [Sinobacterium sp.]